jgi:hypothetical protein
MGKNLNSTLRFRKARNSADLQGQVFTPPSIATLLVESVPHDCSTIIDVGAGTGALALAALGKCPDANAFLIEKDPFYSDKLKSYSIKNTKVIAQDALACGLLEGILRDGGKNIILSNPPYGMDRVNNLPCLKVEDDGLSPYVNGGWVRRDAAFLCRIWNSSGKGDVVGFIVAAPIITGVEHKELRKRLVKELAGLVVTELHPNTFNKTEVQAYLVTGCRSVKRARNVVLRQADVNGEVGREIIISSDSAIQRLDFTYHSNVHELRLRPEQILSGLADAGALISRGSRSQNKYRELGIQAFHTTDFALNSKSLSLDGAIEGYNSARAGDFLIPRVGTRCLIREAKVVKGAGLITDCIYRIRVPVPMQKRVWNTINSDFGREWRRIAAKGYCAKYITISSLASMPILI